jgi:uncharacterized protein (UPF0332 family)
MKFDDSISDLRKQNLIKKCPVDYKAISSLIKRAKKDLNTAERNLDIDEDCSFTYAYNAMLRSGIALMFSLGYRPEIKDKHLTIIRFVGAVLGKELGSLIDMYDYMRKKRHRFIYEPFTSCTKKEAEEAIESAKEFVKEISKFIKY